MILSFKPDSFVGSTLDFDIQKYNRFKCINKKYCDEVEVKCNYDNKIISAIKSRCAEFKFNPIKPNIMKSQLEYIAKSENLSYTDNTMDIISNISKGDMRKAINLLQSALSVFVLRRHC